MMAMHSPVKLRWFLVVSVLVAFGVLARSPTPAHAQVDTMTIDMGLFGGAPTYRASGFIYGLSLGAKYSMLLSALWGSDGPCNVPRWPGDGGNWTEYTRFLNQIINDARANGMTGSDVRWDMWNEPNIFFWGRSQAQYLEMIRRGTQIVRAAIPGAVIEGPSFARVPSPSTAWFNTYLDFVDSNNVVPDIISWHDLPGDPAVDRNNLNGMLASRGISIAGVSVNEYGAFGAQQQPGASAS